MGLLTCVECRRILEENEFFFRKQENRRNRKCRDCDNRRRRAHRLSQAEDNGNWLFFGCCHLPFEHPDMVDWLAALNGKYNFGRVFMMGDLYDFEGMNRFGKNPNLPSPKQEYERTLEPRERLYSLFPKVDMIYGNHDIRPLMRAAEHYLPDFLLKDLREVMGLPEGWVTNGSHLVVEHPSWGEILLIHGDKVNRNALTNAKAIGKHVVMADRHTMCNTGMVETLLGETRLGINTGCIIDAQKEAFAYGHKRIMWPVISIGAIIDGNPCNIVMRQDQTRRWSGTL